MVVNNGTDQRTVEATFAFVDLAGYSVLTEICGDHEAARLAARLAELARTALHPDVCLVKTIGDAVMLAAATPEQMVATIGELADLVADEDGFLALRAGIHHGSAIHQGSDYYGHAVNIAARVTALAGAGQAVITEPIRETAAKLGRTPQPLGPTPLRNITTPVELYTVALTAARYPRDPVCGMRIDPATAPTRLRHNDHDWWFCSTECAHRFTAAPTHYTRQPHRGRLEQETRS